MSNTAKIKIERLGEGFDPVTIRRGGDGAVLMSSLADAATGERLPDVGVSWDALSDHVVVDVSAIDTRAMQLADELEKVTADRNANGDAWVDAKSERDALKAELEELRDELRIANEAHVDGPGGRRGRWTTIRVERLHELQALESSVKKGQRHEIKRAKLEATRLGLDESRIEKFSDVLDVFAQAASQACSVDGAAVIDVCKEAGVVVTDESDEPGARPVRWALAAIRERDEARAERDAARAEAVDMCNAIGAALRPSMATALGDERDDIVDAAVAAIEYGQAEKASASEQLAANLKTLANLERELKSARATSRELLVRERARASAWRAKAEVLHLDRAKRTWDDIVAGIERECGAPVGGETATIGRDIHQWIWVDFAETLSGVTVPITVDGRIVNVKVPQGISDGATLHLHGQGVGAGALRVTVRVREDASTAGNAGAVSGVGHVPGATQPAAEVE